MREENRREERATSWKSNSWPLCSCLLLDRNLFCCFHGHWSFISGYRNAGLISRIGDDVTVTLPTAATYKGKGDRTEERKEESHQLGNAIQCNAIRCNAIKHCAVLWSCGMRYWLDETIQFYTLVQCHAMPCYAMMWVSMPWYVWCVMITAITITQAVMPCHPRPLPLPWHPLHPIPSHCHRQQSTACILFFLERQ